MTISIFILTLKSSNLNVLRHNATCFLVYSEYLYLFLHSFCLFYFFGFHTTALQRNNMTGHHGKTFGNSLWLLLDYYKPYIWGKYLDIDERKLCEAVITCWSRQWERGRTVLPLQRSYWQRSRLETQQHNTECHNNHTLLLSSHLDSTAIKRAVNHGPWEMFVHVFTDESWHADKYPAAGRDKTQTVFLWNNRSSDKKTGNETKNIYAAVSNASVSTTNRD